MGAYLLQRVFSKDGAAPTTKQPSTGGVRGRLPSSQAAGGAAALKAPPAVTRRAAATLAATASAALVSDARPSLPAQLRLEQRAAVAAHAARVGAPAARQPDAVVSRRAAAAFMRQHSALL
jgi:hypothetical protein